MTIKSKKIIEYRNINSVNLYCLERQANELLNRGWIFNSNIFFIRSYCIALKLRKEDNYVRNCKIIHDYNRKEFLKKLMPYASEGWQLHDTFTYINKFYVQIIIKKGNLLSTF